jgi:hypothetical protein
MKLSADVGLTMAVYTAEPGSPSQGALKLLASWAATLDQAEAANRVDGLWPAAAEPARRSWLRDRVHRSWHHGGAAPWGWQETAILHPKEGPGASDKASDNGPRPRQTQRDAVRHSRPSELR